VGAETEDIRFYLRTFFRPLSSWVHRVIALLPGTISRNQTLPAVMPNAHFYVRNHFQIPKNKFLVGPRRRRRSALHRREDLSSLDEIGGTEAFGERVQDRAKVADAVVRMATVRGVATQPGCSTELRHPSLHVAGSLERQSVPMIGV